VRAREKIGKKRRDEEEEELERGNQKSGLGANRGTAARWKGVGLNLPLDGVQDGDRHPQRTRLKSPGDMCACAINHQSGNGISSF